MKHALLRSRPLLTATIVLALAACARAPAKLDHPVLRNDVPLAGLDTPVRAGWPAAQWWRKYDDPQLDKLIEQAVRQSPDIALAQTRVQSAQQSVQLAAAQMGLSINGNAQVARQRMSEHGLIPSEFLGFTWYNQADIGLQLQYDFDWWGKKRATVEAALDEAHAAQAQRSAAALAIQYAVADTYFGWQADQARLQLVKQMLSTQQQLAQIATLRVRQGVDLPDETQKANARVAALNGMRVAIEGSAQIRRVALAALLGIAPAEFPELHVRPLPAVERGIPTDAGIDLIARRPDIVASRWQVESMLKKTDAARAAFFPDIGISAMAGLSSIEMDKLFTLGSRTFALTPALHLPIFNGGALEANYGLSKAQLDSAVAQYNSAVLGAARDVATQALNAEQLAARRNAQQGELDTDRQLLATALARLRQGVRDGRESLAAKAQLLQQRDTAVQLQSQALSADLALIKALGGGYRRTDTLPMSRPAPHSSSTGAADHERH